jgi:hypothetical protein
LNRSACRRDALAIIKTNSAASPLYWIGDAADAIVVNGIGISAT